MMVERLSSRAYSSLDSSHRLLRPNRLTSSTKSATFG